MYKTNLAKLNRKGSKFLFLSGLSFRMRNQYEQTVYKRLSLIKTWNFLWRTGFMEPNYTLDYHDDDFEMRFSPGFLVPIKMIFYSKEELQKLDSELVQHMDFLGTKFKDLAWIACNYIRNKLIPKSMCWQDLFIEYLWMRPFRTSKAFRADFRSKVKFGRHRGSEQLKILRCNLIATNSDKRVHIGTAEYYSSPERPGTTSLSLNGMVKAEIIPPLTDLEISVYKTIKRISMNENALILIEEMNTDVRDRHDPYFDDTDAFFLKDDDNITSGDAFADTMKELFDTCKPNNKMRRQSLVLSWELIRQFKRLDQVLDKLNLQERTSFIYNLYSINNVFSVFD